MTDTQKNNPKDTPETLETNDTQYGSSLLILNTAIIILLVILGLAIHNGKLHSFQETHKVTKTEVTDHKQNKNTENQRWITPHISSQTKTHILYGDKTGGAHYHTITTPCKSLFPKDWSPEKIIEVTEKIATNDNLKWNPRKNGNMYAKSTEDGIIVGVIMDPQRKYVITSFPLNTERNPCPKGDIEEKTTKTEVENKEEADITIEHRYDHNN